jgi:transposase
MSQTNIHTLFAGLDVAKSSLQLHLANRLHSFSNDPKGHRQLIKLLHDYDPVHIVLEATGGYEQTIMEALQVNGVVVSRVEPGRVRHFAKAKGLRAKTDPIDAAILTQYGQAFTPDPTPPASPVQKLLAQLATRRRQLVHLLTLARNHAEHYTDSFSRKQSRQLSALLEKQIAQCEAELALVLQQDQTLQSQAQRLDAIPGVGPLTAALLLAEMPELGSLTTQQTAALAGLAPYNSDSGDHTGKRRIAGGRKNVRCSLYMAALSAVKHDRILKAFYLRLRLAGKKPLVALTACMRKLIVLMNRLLKNPNFQLAS